MMSDHNFVLSDQGGVLVGHNMSFQVKQIICSPVNGNLNKFSHAWVDTEFLRRGWKVQTIKDGDL